MAIISRRVAFGLRCCLLAAPLLLQACAEKPPPQGPLATPVFHADLVGGARQCSASTPVLKSGRQASATIKVGNDGGWCAIHVRQDGKPYAAGLLTQQPRHGKVFIHPVGNDTRIDYTPAPGYVGADSFAVQLIPGNPTIRVAVTVTR